ncbi:hypothetical protein DFQ26_000529, partial [Actinomortierella ambigua]
MAPQFNLSEHVVRSFRPNQFDGRFRGSKTEDWLNSVDTYCSAMSMVHDRSQQNWYGQPSTDAGRVKM